jgi:hypothetical protein
MVWKSRGTDAGLVQGAQRQMEKPPRPSKTEDTYQTLHVDFVSDHSVADLGIVNVMKSQDCPDFLCACRQTGWHPRKESFCGK